MHQDARRYLVAAVVLLAAAGLVQVAAALRGVEAKYEVDFSRVSMRIGEYKARRLPVEESIFAYLGANAMEERLYEGPERQIRLAMVYGTDWRSIHAPTGCYPAQGWHIVHNRAIELPAPADNPHPGPLHARVLEATKGDAHELALFVYARPGGTTSDWTTHGWKVATGPRGAGGMIIILQSPITKRDVKGAQDAMKQLLAAIYPKAVSFWYDHKTTT